MKVCHYTAVEDGIKGGIIPSVRQQRKALDKAGVDVTQDPSEEHDILHINVLDPKSLYQALRTKRNGGKVVVHAHTTGKNFKGTWRFSDITWPIADKILNFIYKRTDLVIAPSAFAREYLLSRGFDEDHVTTISNGVDTERLDGYEPDENLNEKYGATDPTVINLALIFERKGLTDFIATAEMTPDIDYRWFGERLNSLLAPRSIDRQIEDAPDNVAFPGYVDDVREAFTLGDIFFFPTKDETQGIVILEAAYSEVPIVTRDIPVFEGWLEHEENCLKADSPAGFREQIERLEEDDDLRETITENAREMAEDHTLEKIGEKLKETYSTLLED